MPPLVKQPVQVTFGSADQRRGGKFLLPGRLTKAENVYQTKTKEYRKRNGFTVMDRVADTGSITTGADLTTTGDQLVLRTADSVYVRSQANGLWNFKGALKPVTAQMAGTAPNIVYRPAHCVENGRIWTTWIDGTGAVYYNVIEEATGNELLGPTAIPGAGAGLSFAKPVAAAGFVWVFAGPPASLANNVITCSKLTTGNPGTPATTTTFANPSGTWEAWDVLDAGVNGIIFGYLGSLNFGDGFGVASFSVAKLNTGTGLPGTWQHNAGGGTGPAHFVRNAVGGDGSFYFGCNGSGNISEYRINATTLAITGTFTVATGLLTTKAGLVGYQDPGNNHRVYFASADSFTLRDDALINRADYNGTSSVVTSNWHRAATVASDPFLVGTAPYLMIAHDDGKGLQTGYTVVDAITGQHLSRTLYQLGGPHWFAQSGFAVDKIDYGWVTTAHVSGGKAYTNGMTPGSLVFGVNPVSYQLDRLIFDFADTMLGPPLAALNGRSILFPGGWPLTLAGESANLQDLGPMMYPRQTGNISGSGIGSGLAGGTYQLAVVYAQYDRDGNVMRSSPSVLGQVNISAGNTILLSPPTDRWLTDNRRVFIEAYLSAAGQVAPLFLSSRAPNDPTVDLVNLTIGNLGTEILYTDGGVLDNIAPPSFRHAFAWASAGGYRVFLLGTDILGEVWPSKEVVAGAGPLFQETFRFTVRWGTGPVTAGGPVDFNYAAIFKQDAVAVISGAGPDPSGHGGFVPQLVTDAPGCTRPRSVVSGPPGLFYQAVTGEIWLINHGAQATRISDGIDDYEGEPVIAAVHWQERSLILFVTAGGGTTTRVLVWDYGSPLPEEGSLGQWYVWNIPTTGAAIAATVQQGAFYVLDSTGRVWKETPGQYYDYDGVTQTAVSRKVRLPLVLSGVRGYQRLYRGQVVGQFRSAHTIKITVDTYDGAPGEAGGSTENWTKAVTSGPELFEFRPSQGRVTAFDITMEDAGSDLTEGATFDGMGLEVGVKGGLPRVGSSQKF